LVKRAIFYSKAGTPADDFQWLRRHGFDTAITGNDPAEARRR